MFQRGSDVDLWLTLDNIDHRLRSKRKQSKFSRIMNRVCVLAILAYIIYVAFFAGPVNLTELIK